MILTIYYYFNMQYFELAIRLFERVIIDYPDTKISILDCENEFVITEAKCHYAIVNYHLALNELDNAKKN